MAMKRRDVTEAVSLRDSAAATANGTSTQVTLPHMPNGFAFVLDSTAGGTDNSDAIDITIQTKLDGPNGDQWLDVVAFAQVTGDAPNKTHIEKINAGAAEAGFEIATALAAGEVRNLIGDVWRGSWTVTNGNNATFTFSLTACPM